MKNKKGNEVRYVSLTLPIDVYHTIKTAMEIESSTMKPGILWRFIADAALEKSTKIIESHARNGL